MDMKQHILAALREEFKEWEALLSRLSEAQACEPLTSETAQPFEWTVKDVVAHLLAWQQRSIKRFEAAQNNREPEFPRWVEGLDPETEANTEPINAWIYANYRDQPWPQVHQSWREGFLRFLEVAETIPERDLLDGSRYAWLQGSPLATVLLGSYDHHQEHYEMLIARLGKQHE